MSSKTIINKFVFIIGLIFLVIILISVNQAKADIEWGKVSWEGADDSIVYGSLSTLSGISTFDKLGTNDYIPENAFKNVLALDGYSVAYDYNPKYTGLYSSYYLQALPDDVKLQKIEIKGLMSDPTKTQDVYVLKSEYEALSAVGQDKRIIQEESNRISSDNTLQTNINKEVTNRTNADNILQTNINNEAIVRNNTDNQLNNKIVKVDNYQSNWNTEQDGDISNLNNRVNNQNQRIDDMDNRVKKLEQTKYIFQPEVRIYDSQKWTITVFTSFNMNNNSHFDAVGLRATFKMGKSYEERRIDELEAKINKLLHIATKKQEEPIYYMTPNGIGIKQNF